MDLHTNLGKVETAQQRKGRMAERLRQHNSERKDGGKVDTAQQQKEGRRKSWDSTTAKGRTVERLGQHNSKRKHGGKVETAQLQKEERQKGWDSTTAKGRTSRDLISVVRDSRIEAYTKDSRISHDLATPPDVMW
eukprot:1148949-Pelagomonas_calceolata.AAC.6